MKCSESWLREWVNPNLTRKALCKTLTMAGLEVDSVEPVALETDPIHVMDYAIDIAITPNRGDCLSIRGIAREVAALTQTSLTPVKPIEVLATANQQLSIQIDTKSACPRYVGRVIHQVKTDVETPQWIKDRLQLGGIRIINPVVDVTNYVMLELGQPMHAFDLNQIEHQIVVRKAKEGERLLLLDGSEKTLDNQTLIIADESKPLAIAGVMGGLDSSVTLTTTDIFLESAYFSPNEVARQRQYYQLSSDSAYRFERGVDPTIQREAIERATQLILQIAGGEPGAVIESVQADDLPQAKQIAFSLNKLKQTLGIEIPEEQVRQIFVALGFYVKSIAEHEWLVTVPAYRFDVALPEDLMEEVARCYGYDCIPTHHLKATLQPHSFKMNEQDNYIIKEALVARDYHEIISYSFVDKALQLLLNPAILPKPLINPMTTEMAVMRTNLWPGLISTLRYNLSRQQRRVRLFEWGTCFILENDMLQQIDQVAGLVTGPLYPEQWGIPSREVDFFDLKGDVESLFNLTHTHPLITFKATEHPALHPGQTAGIYKDDKQIGIIGALHPTVLQALDIPQNVFLFEIAGESLKKAGRMPYKELSKFPEIRRDLAILVDEAIPIQLIQDTIKLIAGDWLKEVFVFDVYQGKGISPELKSVALALVFQHPTRTLVDEEVATLMERVTLTLSEQLGAVLRS